jgi:hypothetical protein
MTHNPTYAPPYERRGSAVNGDSFKASDYVWAAARMRVTARYSGSWAADDFRLADKWEAEARTKQLPSTRIEIGAGGELIDRENNRENRLTVDTVAARAGESGGIVESCVRRCRTIQAQDSLEKMLVHQMAVLHHGMMKATARMNEELDAAGVIDPIDPNKREAANSHGEAHSSTGERDARRASGGRGRQGNEQDQGTAGERRERRRGDGQK